MYSNRTLRKLVNSKKFSINKTFANFSTTNFSRVIVVGAGAGGLAVANQLVSAKAVTNKEITIFDPKKYIITNQGLLKLVEE